MGGGDEAGRGHGGCVCVGQRVWANVGWIATSRDGIATGEMECISIRIIVGDGRGLDWRRGVDMDGVLY
jgi:hypothetical protein